MTYDFVLETIIPATPDAIFDAWMSSEGHTAMTGGEAEIDPEVGGGHSAHFGYITGVTTALDRARRIEQTWRTSHFEPDHEDSTIEVLLEEHAGGCRVVLHHRNVPAEQTNYENGGWQDNYFEPMAAYFSGG